MFEWCVVWYGFENKYQEDMCKIGLHTLKMITLIGLIRVNLYDHLLSMRIFTLIMNKIFI